VRAWVTIADLLAIALIVIAVVVRATGGFHTVVFHVRLSMTTAWRPAVLALLVITARHLGFRRPNLLARISAILARASALLVQLWARWHPFRLVPDDCVCLSDGARRALRMPARELALVTGLMIVLTGLMTYPQIAHLDRVPDLGDPLFSMWRMAWTAHQLPRDPLHLFDGNMFHPERLTLAYSDSILLPAVAASPFLWFGAPTVMVYNVLMLATFVLAGVAMFVLVRALTGRAPAALVAAVVFSFYPFRFEHYSHFELMFSFWMPLVLLAVHRTLAFGRIRDGALTAAAFAGQVFSCIYFGIFLAVYLAPFWAVVAIGWRRVRRGLAPLALGAVLAGMALAPLAVPYVEARQTVGERSTDETMYYSALPRDYLNPHWSSATYSAFRRDPRPERELFPGILAVTLALIALWPPVSVSRLAYGVGLLFAFDASLGFHGYSYAFLYRFVPAFHSLRVPARISMMVGCSLAVLAGYGIARLTRSARSPVRWVVAGLAVLVILVESRPVLWYQPVSTKPAAIYAWFNGRPPAVLAELPPGTRKELNREFLYLYASTFHWQRLLNGTSGFTPASYWEFSDAMADFPDDRAMALLAARGTDYVMVHEQFYGPGPYRSVVTRAAERSDLREVSRAREGRFEVRLYQIVR
jgi:hypothetical protein